MKFLFSAILACGVAVPAVAAPSPISARSVHMWHPAPDAEWMYGEVTVEKSVPGSYFAAICFSCGYCGIQELYDGKKVAIFSVWDPGDPFDFKAKADNVDEKVRTKNLYAGEGVAISRFGGEGTGGKSMLPFDWKIGETYRFAIHSRQDTGRRSPVTSSAMARGSRSRLSPRFRREAPTPSKASTALSRTSAATRNRVARFAARGSRTSSRSPSTEIGCR